MNNTTPERMHRIKWANTITPEPVIWAWTDTDGGRIPSGSLSIAAGREGTGKSSFGIWLAAQITTGTLPGQFHGQPRNVFYVAVEDSWKYTLVPRLMAAGADLSKVGRFDVVNLEGEEVTLSLPTDNQVLHDAIEQYQAALVVIDPLMSAIGDSIDTHKERDVRKALDPLAKMADNTGAIILGIAHFNKGGGSDAASLITGSGAFKNVPRTVFGFARDEQSEDGSRVISQVKNSLGRDDLPSLEYRISEATINTAAGIITTGKFELQGVSKRSVAELLREANSTGDDSHTERREIDAWLEDYLITEGGIARAREVIQNAKEAGFTENQIKKARTRIGATTKRHGAGPGSYIEWRHPSAIDSIESTDSGQESRESMAPMVESDTHQQGVLG